MTTDGFKKQRAEIERLIAFFQELAQRFPAYQKTVDKLERERVDLVNQIGLK